MYMYMNGRYDNYSSQWVGSAVSSLPRYDLGERLGCHSLSAERGLHKID